MKRRYIKPKRRYAETSLHVSETLVTPSCNVATLAKPCSVVRLEDRCYPPEFWGELVGIPREDFSGSTGICLVEVGDDDLLHLHHGLHGAIGLFAIGIAQVTAEGRGHNLSVAILRASSSARRIAAERPGASSTCGGADLETQKPEQLGRHFPWQVNMDLLLRWVADGIERLRPDGLLRSDDRDRRSLGLGQLPRLSADKQRQNRAKR